MPNLRHAFAILFLVAATSSPALCQTETGQPAIAPAAKSAAGDTAAPDGSETKPAGAAEEPAAEGDHQAADKAPPEDQKAAEPAPAAEPVESVLPPEVTSKITNLVGVMDGAEKTLTALGSVDTDLGRLRDDIDQVISKTTQTADGLRPRLSDLQVQLNKLGPPPQKGAPAEAPAVAGERQRLAKEVSDVSGAVKTLEVTWWRARQAIDKITELRLKLFVKSITQRISSPLFPEIWGDIARVAPSVSWRLHYNSADWISSINRQKINVTMLLAAAIGLYLLLKSIVLAVTRYRPKLDGTPMTFFERAASASWQAPARAVPGLATALFLYGGLDYLGLLYYPTAAPTAAALLRAVLVYISVAALLSAVFSPGRPERRMVALSNRSARRISRLLKVLAAIFAADLFLSAFAQVLYFPLALSVVQSLFTSVAFAFVLIGLALTPIETLNGDTLKRSGKSRPIWLKAPLWLAAGTIIMSCMLGYVAFARFLSQQLVMTGVVGLIATLLYLAIRAFTRGNSTTHGHISTVLQQQMGFDDVRRRQLAWVAESLLTLGLALVAIPVILLQWGFSAADIRDWTKQLLFGFEIGQFRISLVRIIVGALLFIALLFVTRMVQRRIRDNILVRPRMDPGIANSVDTTIGYAGTAIAAIIAISYAGFDITNLAIVAGALSVGIGFGLQSIVNNFVSGLILLIERPIKVGDWVVIGNEQGNVKRISVRSTEIETFDRASLIVPNSELITGRVLNWTHRNALGRVVLKFSAGPDADPRKVIAVLTECATRHPELMREPAPLAVFEGYTADSTEYSLRVLLPDINRGLRVQSDLRIAVYEALKRTQAIPREGDVEAGQAVGPN